MIINTAIQKIDALLKDAKFELLSKKCSVGGSYQVITDLIYTNDKGECIYITAPTNIFRDVVMLNGLTVEQYEAEISGTDHTRQGKHGK